MSWERHKLENLSSVITKGTTPTTVGYKFTDTGIPFVRVNNFSERSLNYQRNILYISKETHHALNRSQIHSGDVLLSIAGTIGRSCVVPNEIGDLNCNQAVCLIRPITDALCPAYAQLWLSSVDAIQQCTSGKVTGVISNLSLTSVRNLQIPLPMKNGKPDLLEQQRIAGILDQADAIRRKRQQALQLTDDFLRATFLDLFGDPVTNPKGWETDQLINLILPIDSGSSPRCHTHPASLDEWGVLKLGSVTKCKFLPDENKALPVDVTPNPSNEVQSGDLLFSRKNTHQLVAAPAFVFETRQRLLLPDLIFRITPKPEANLRNEFLWQQLLHPHLRQKIQSLAGGAAGSMPNISKRKLEDVTIITPPQALQNQFAEICHTWWRKYKRAQELSSITNDLFASLQQRAFKGEL